MHCRTEVDIYRLLGPLASRWDASMGCALTLGSRCAALLSPRRSSAPPIMSDARWRQTRQATQMQPQPGHPIAPRAAASAAAAASAQPPPTRSLLRAHLSGAPLGIHTRSTPAADASAATSTLTRTAAARASTPLSLTRTTRPAGAPLGSNSAGAMATATSPAAVRTSAAQRANASATGSVAAVAAAPAMRLASPSLASAPRSALPSAAVRPLVANSHLARFSMRPSPQRGLVAQQRQAHDDSDEDDASDFPHPPSYVESKRIAAAEIALRDARAVRATAAAVTASMAATTHATRGTPSTPVRVPSTPSLHSASSATPVAVPSAAPAAAIDTSSPNQRRRLTGSPAAASTAAASNYSSGIAMLEQRYDSLFSPAAVAARAAASDSASNRSSLGASSSTIPSTATSASAAGLRSLGDFTPLSLMAAPRSSATNSLSTAPASSVASFSTPTPAARFPLASASSYPATSAATTGPSVQSEMSRLRSEWRAGMQERKDAHDDRQRTNMVEAAARYSERDRAAAASAAPVHPLAGLRSAPRSGPTDAGSPYPYADRGSQLATLARQAHSTRPAGSSSSLSAASAALLSYDEEPARLERELQALANDDDEGMAHAAAAALASQQARTLDRERERERDPFRLTRQDRDRSQAAARVNRLQSSIDSELASIHRSRGLGSGPSAMRPAGSITLADLEERKWDLHSDDNSEEDPDEEDDADDEPVVEDWRAPTSTHTRASVPPPRGTQRVVTANFTPMLSASERLRQQVGALPASASEPFSSSSSSSTPDPITSALNDARARVAAIRAHPSPYEPITPAAAAALRARVNQQQAAAAEVAARAASASASAAAAAAAVPAADPVAVRFGSLSVRAERAEVLRQEMLFLSSLFDNVRSYQLSLVQSLRDAGFVDQAAMERLPGLQEGLVHQLIEAAWNAAARQAGLDVENGNVPPNAGPKLPVGHAERVKRMVSMTLVKAADDDCCICLDSMPSGAVVSDLKTCKHMFHTQCIQEWLSKANTCPLCKRTAIEEEEIAITARGPAAPPQPAVFG